VAVVRSAGVSSVLTGNVTRPGLTIRAGQTVVFNPARSTTLTVTGNVIVRGTLRMRPANAGVVHKRGFAKVNEQAMVGGGMNPLASDVGLLVRADWT
jgi:hypothetical protein